MEMYSLGVGPLQGRQPPSVVVGVMKSKVNFELIAWVVMIALDGRFLDRSVRALDLAIGPGMFDLGQPMFDPVLWKRISNICVSCRRAIRIARREGEVDLIVGENCVVL